MASFSTQTGTAEAALLGEYWDSEVLDNQWPELFHYQFAEKKRLPGGVGKTLHFTRFTKFAANKMASLGEAAYTVLEPSLMSADEISTTVYQYGHGILFSDFFLLTARFNVVDEALAQLGQEAGRWTDEFLVACAIAGRSIVRGAGGVSLITSDSNLTSDDVYWASTKLASMNAKKFRTGTWVCIGHPGALHHIKTDAGTQGWFELNKYTAANIRELKGYSIGMMGLIQFFQSTNMTSLASNAALSIMYSGAGKVNFNSNHVYITRFIGPGAYGAVNLEGGAVSTYIKKLGSAGAWDLVNQRAGVGIKLFMGALDISPSASNEKRLIEFVSYNNGDF